MEAHARAPEALKDNKPMDKTWRMWKQEFLIFLRVAGYDKKDSNAKANLLLNTMGKLGLTVMDDIEFNSEEDKQDFDILLKKFDEHFDPPKRETEERYKFYNRHKKNNEPIEAYINDLKEKAKTCNFGELTEGLVRDMVILDIKDKHLRQIMFDAKDLTLDKMIMLYKQFELTTEKMQEVSKNATKESAEAKLKDSHKSSSHTKVCWRCGTTHDAKNCPAFKTVCDRCNEKGHFTQRCQNKNNAAKTNNAKNDNTNKNENKNKNYTKNPFNQNKK